MYPLTIPEIFFYLMRNVMVVDKELRYCVGVLLSQTLRKYLG